MKIIKTTFAILSLTIILMAPALLLAQPVRPEDLAKPPTCPYETLKDCQQWVLEQAGGGTGGYGTTGLGVGDPKLLATKVGEVIGMVLSVFGVVFLGLTVYSGIQWMTAGGNEEKVTKARERIIRAAIGLGIIIMSYALTSFIVTRMQGVSEQQPPEQINCHQFDHNEPGCRAAGPSCMWTPDFDECANIDE